MKKQVVWKMECNVEDQDVGLAPGGNLNSWKTEQKKCLINRVKIRNIWRTNEQAVHLVIVVFLAMKKRCALHVVLFTL